MSTAVASVEPAVAVEADDIVEDSQMPEGGPLLVIEETYGNLADNGLEDDESAGEETQETQLGQSESTAPKEPLVLFASDDNLASFSNRIDMKNFVQMMGILSMWSTQMLTRFAELRSEVDQLRRELRDESSQRKTAESNRDNERRRRLELEADLAVADEKLAKVSVALGIPST